MATWSSKWTLERGGWVTTSCCVPRVTQDKHLIGKKLWRPRVESVTPHYGDSQAALLSEGVATRIVLPK